MSKVKNIPKELGSYKQKEKLRGNLRRVESEKIKKKRMDNARRFGYGYRYYIKDSVVIRRRKTVSIPEHTEPVYHFEMYEKELEGRPGQIYRKCFYKSVFDGYKTVPEQTITFSKVIEEIPRKPYLKMMNERKKWLKRQGAKRVRNSSQDFLSRHGDYKKLYDLWWTLW